MQSLRLSSLVISAAAMLATVSCSDSVVEGVMPKVNPLDDYVTTVNLNVEDFEYVGDGTRTQISPSASIEGLQFSWKKDDKIGVVPVKGWFDTYQNLEFTVDQDNTDGQNAKFVNGGFMLKKDMKYAAYYPYSYETQLPGYMIERIPASFRGQLQRYNYNTDHLGKYDYMAAKPVQSTDGSLTFNFIHFGTICHFTLTLPEIADNTKLKSMYISFMNSSNQTVKIPVVGLICDISNSDELSFYYNRYFEDNMDICLKVELSDVLPNAEKTVDLFAMMPPYLFNGSLEEDPKTMQVTLVDANDCVHSCFFSLPVQGDYSGKVLSFAKDVYKATASTNAELSGRAFNNAIKECIDPVAIKKVVFENNADFDFGGYEINLPNSNGIFQTKAHLDLNDLTLTVATDAKKIMLSDGFSMFKDFISMTEIEGLPILDTSNMSSTANMFTNCSSLKTLDLSTFDNKNVYNFAEMFDGCSNLTDLTWSEKFIQTSKDVYFKRMFRNCSALEAIDFSLFDQTINITDSMTSMFENCEEITQLDVSRFNTAKVVDMTDVFWKCKQVNFEENAFVNWNTSNVGSMRFMFSECDSIEVLNLNSFYTPKVESMTQMFSWCTSLRKVDMKNIDTSSLKYCNGMFMCCWHIDDIDLHWGTFDKVEQIWNMFWGTTTLKSLDIANMALNPNIINLFKQDMFRECGILTYHEDNRTVITIANKKMEPLFDDSNFRAITGFRPEFFSIGYVEH